MTRRRMVWQPNRLQFVGSYQVATPVSATDSYNLPYDGNLVGGIDTNVRVGDLVVAYWGANETGGVTFTTTPGWTKEADLFANDTYDTDAGVIYRVMTSTPDTSVDMDFSSPIFANIGCHVFRGASITTPLDAVTQSSVGINGAQPNPPAITKGADTSWIFAFGAAGGFGSAGSGDPRYIDPLTSSDLDGFATVGMGFSAIGAGYSATVTDPAAFGGGSTDVTTSRAQVTMSIAKR